METMVFASPPIMCIPKPLNNGHVAGLGSQSLLTRKWIHEATKYLVELAMEHIENYGTAIFKQQHWERIREQVTTDHPSVAQQP